MVATCRPGPARASPDYSRRCGIFGACARRPRRPDVVTLFADDVLSSCGNTDLSKGHFPQQAVTSGLSVLSCLNVVVTDWTPSCVCSCVQVEEHHAVDIDVYHCPNCDVVQGPSLSEYLSSVGQDLHGFPHPTPRRLRVPSSLSGGERVSLQSEFFFSSMGGWAHP